MGTRETTPSWCPFGGEQFYPIGQSSLLPSFLIGDYSFFLKKKETQPGEGYRKSHTSPEVLWASFWKETGRQRWWLWSQASVGLAGPQPHPAPLEAARAAPCCWPPLPRTVLVVMPRVTGGSPGFSLYLVARKAEIFLLICKESIEGDTKACFFTLNNKICSPVPQPRRQTKWRFNDNTPKQSLLEWCLSCVVLRFFSKRI